MNRTRPATQSRTWPLAVTGLATFGALIAAFLIVVIQGYPGDRIYPAMPEPTLLHYALAAACLVPPLATIPVLLLRPSHPWRTVLLMLATVFGLVDLLVGVLGVVLAIVIAQSILRGSYPRFF